MLLLIIIAVFCSVVLFVRVLWPEKPVDLKKLYASHKERSGLLLLISPLINKLADKNKKLKGPRIEKYRADLRKQLTSSGNTAGLNPDEMIALGQITAVVLFFISIWTTGLLEMPWTNRILLSLLLIPIGLFYPAFSLKGQTAKRHMVIRRALPYSLDLLTVAVEAGLDFAAAVGRVVEKGKGSALNEEFFLMLQEIRMGKTRQEALRAMSERVNLPELGSIISALIQADQLGTSLGPILRIQSDQLRVKRSQRAEKLALEAPVKMLLPLLGCIFPAVFVILLAPIVFQFMQGGL